MQIDAYQMHQGAVHHDRREHSIREAFESWQRPAVDRPNPSKMPDNDPVSLSQEGIERQALDAAEEDSPGSTPTLNVLRRMIELLTGEKIRVFDARALEASVSQTQTTAFEQQSSLQTGGPGARYEYSETYREYESLQFSASGTVRTRDGQEITFSLDLSIERTYEISRSTQISIGAPPPAKDPLVLNFDGNAAELQDQSFRFDLLGTGQPQTLPTLGPGSGFLVFDRNRDGRANDGRELFGPTSGNGFGELRQLDQDGNGWIDAADPAFDQLSVWRPSAGDAANLQSLTQLGIGALNLDALSTPFSLTNAHNERLGNIRETSIFLRELGGTGTIQQIDLTV